MKTLALALVALFFTLGLQAQVTVEVRLEQSQFVSKESIPVAVRIVNHSGQTLHFGKDPDWLLFSLEAADGHVVLQTDNVPVQGEFDLETSKVATKRVDIMPYFNLDRIGHYRITATVKMKDWLVDVSNENPAHFEITHGTRLWEQTFGLPPADGESHARPEIRKFILQQVTYSKLMKMYVRVTDVSESTVLKVIPIGPMVTFSRPDPMIDQHSNLHVVYQCGARLYNYSIVSPEGQLLLRQSYDVTGNRPHLKIDATGKIGIVDGIRRITAEDVPPAPQPVPTNDSQPPKQ